MSGYLASCWFCLFIESHIHRSVDFSVCFVHYQVTEKRVCEIFVLVCQIEKLHFVSHIHRSVDFSVCFVHYQVTEKHVCEMFVSVCEMEELNFVSHIHQSVDFSVCFAHYQEIEKCACKMFVLVHILCPYNLFGRIVKSSASRTEDPGFSLRLHHGVFPDRVIPVT